MPISNEGIDLENSVLRTEGQTWLLPLEFTEAVRTGRLRRVASPQQDDGSNELRWLPDNVFQELSAAASPRYWIHILEGDKTEAWPVYGYMAEYGYRWVTPPILREDEGRDWSDAEWLCRCAQCGREMPPGYYNINTSGRIFGVCKACRNANNIIDKIFWKDLRYWSEDEMHLMETAQNWYERLWHAGLAPRGDYASHILGRDQIVDRINHTMKHRKGSTRTGPNRTTSRKIEAVQALMDQSEFFTYPENSCIHSDPQVI